MMDQWMDRVHVRKAVVEVIGVWHSSAKFRLVD